eukprot:8103595-Ditylum_brightwellii.AAC.1
MTAATTKEEEHHQQVLVEKYIISLMYTTTTNLAVSQIEQKFGDNKNDPMSPANDGSNDVESQLYNNVNTTITSIIGDTIQSSDINSNTSNKCKANKSKALLTYSCGVQKKTTYYLPDELCKYPSLLPKEVQQLFIRRLVETIVDPETFMKCVDMISAMATE